MGIQDVRVVSVPVSDQERAKGFYVEKLGQLVRDDDAVPGFTGFRLHRRGRARR